MSIPVPAMNPAVGVGSATSGAPAALSPGLNKAPSEIDKQDFASMMKGFGTDPATQASAKQKPHEPSFLESFAAVQHANMQNMMQSSRDMVKAAPGMKLEELAMAGIEFKLNLAVTTTQFQIATSVGKSAGKGVDTLMRNQ